jgi:hypothetical protein
MADVQGMIASSEFQSLSPQGQRKALDSLLSTDAQYSAAPETQKLAVVNRLLGEGDSGFNASPEAQIEADRRRRIARASGGQSFGAGAQGEALRAPLAAPGQQRGSLLHQITGIGEAPVTQDVVQPPTNRAQIPPSGEGIGILAEVLNRPFRRLGADVGPGSAETTVEGLVGLGAGAGFAAGTPLGPPGQVGGAILGAGAARLTLGAMGVQDPNLPPKTLGDFADNFVFDSVIEMGGPLMVQAGRYTKNAITRKMADISLEDLGILERSGLPASVELVTNSEFMKRIRDTFGRFALVAKPFKEADVVRAEAVTRRGVQILEEVAPVDSVTNLSKRAVRNARKAWTHFRKESAKRFHVVNDVASKDKSHNIPQDVTRKVAQDMLDELQQAQPGLQDKELIRIIKGFLPDPPKSAASKLVGPGGSPLVPAKVLPPQRMTFQQYRANQKALNRKIEKLIADNNLSGSGALYQIKKALEADLGNATGSQEFLATLNAANDYYHQGKKMFEKTAAKGFEQVDPNIFKTGAQRGGSVTEGKFLTRFADFSDPDLMKQLHALIKRPQGFKGNRNQLSHELAADYISSAFEAGKILDESTGVKRIDLTKVEEALGLFTRGREPKKESLSIMLEGSGVDFEDLENFVSATKLIAGSNIVNVSDFITRRTVLGGIKSGARTFVPGQGKVKKDAGFLDTVGPLVVGPLLFLLTGRKVGKFLTDPKIARGIRIIAKGTPISSRELKVGGKRIGPGPGLGSDEFWDALANDQQRMRAINTAGKAAQEILEREGLSVDDAIGMLMGTGEAAAFTSKTSRIGPIGRHVSGGILGPAALGATMGAREHFGPSRIRGGRAALQDILRQQQQQPSELQGVVDANQQRNRQ